MSDLPRFVHIREEGPREGFQIEPGPIATADKITLVDALSGCGMRHIQVASFVSPKAVPGWADAEQVVAGFAPKPGVDYTALWFNEQGAQRAKAFADRLHLEAAIITSASETFSRKNLNRGRAEQLDVVRRTTATHLALGIPVTRVGVMAAFGCNYEGEVPVAAVLRGIEDGLAIATEAGCAIRDVTLADSMGWVTPGRVERLVGEVRSRWPDLTLVLHLHDTRGLGIAGAHAGLRMGVAHFDTTVAGLGGCPFAGQPGATGNIASEELVLLCEEMGIPTGVDLEALIEAGRLAERIVGRQLPSTVLRSGSFRARRLAA